ncbi:hypothetical protein [Fusobacterium sp. PH5-44]|uniref:hypothetical protein n=1 Tax=unclassified Fusobacterium TaxID=2648384 RepID=UPI003D1ED817
MKKKFFYMILIIIFLDNYSTSFVYGSNKFSNEVKINTLNEVVINIHARIDDITLKQRQPTEKLLILTKILLDKDRTKEYKEKLSLKNKKNDIEDFITYKIGNYTLKNEKDQVVNIVENIPSNRLGEVSLTRDGDKIYQDLYINIRLDNEYEKLFGKINIEFEIDKNIKKTVEIPVVVTINDKK